MFAFCAEGEDVLCCHLFVSVPVQVFNLLCANTFTRLRVPTRNSDYTSLSATADFILLDVVVAGAGSWCCSVYVGWLYVFDLM